MKSSNAILGLFSETSLHAGAGQALGVIDLPIQREAHTYWPCVYGSAVKGALRAKAEAAKLEHINPVFGHSPNNKGTGSEYGGALAVGDARLLLLPVRSLTTHFRWVTCPAALQRLKRDASRLGLAEELDGLAECEIPTTEGETVRVAAAGQGDFLFLEEYRCTVKVEDLTPIVTALAKLMPAGMEDALNRQIAIVADDLFRHLVEHATPVNAHVRLTEQKTVQKGALWYEETLPPETLLYVGLNASATRDSDQALAAEEVLKQIQTELFGQATYLQLGGNETVGMGWCHVAFLSQAPTEG